MLADEPVATGKPVDVEPLVKRCSGVTLKQQHAATARRTATANKTLLAKLVARVDDELYGGAHGALGRRMGCGTITPETARHRVRGLRTVRPRRSALTRPTPGPGVGRRPSSGAGVARRAKTPAEVKHDPPSSSGTQTNPRK